MRRAASRAAWTAGRRRAINTAMIAITTSSSISVKPRGLAAWSGYLIDVPRGCSGENRPTNHDRGLGSFLPSTQHQFLTRWASVRVGRDHLPAGDRPKGAPGLTVDRILDEP